MRYVGEEVCVCVCVRGGGDVAWCKKELRGGMQEGMCPTAEQRGREAWPSLGCSTPLCATCPAYSLPMCSRLPLRTEMGVAVPVATSHTWKPADCGQAAASRWPCTEAGGAAGGLVSLVCTENADMHQLSCLPPALPLL